jgi:hypothetical protein
MRVAHCNAGLQTEKIWPTIPGHDFWVPMTRRDITTGESVGLHFLLIMFVLTRRQVYFCFPVYYGWHSFTSNCDKISQELAATGISHDWLSLLTSCHLLILSSFLLNEGIYSNHHRCPSLMYLIYLYNEAKRPLWFNTKDLLMDFLALWCRTTSCLCSYSHSDSPSMFSAPASQRPTGTRESTTKCKRLEPYTSIEKGAW